MAVGSWVVFHQALDRLDLADMNGVGTFKATLHDADQALTANFTGASGNAQYSDFTDELATASGYTNGGLTLTGVTLNISGTEAVWTCDPIEWTTTGTINVRYVVIRDDVTDFAICFCDLETTLGAGVEQAVVAGFLKVTPHSTDGILTVENI